MNFQLIGVNHNTAPLEVREKLAISACRVPGLLQELLQSPDVIGGLILSTCNRVELMAETRNGGADLRQFLRESCGMAAELEPYLYEYHQADAIHHLFRVAASLDSMVVGEPQILGQVKEAYAIARTAGAIGSQLDQLIMRAFAVAKRIRTETAVGASAVSLASVAVELAEKIFGSLEDKQVYLVGAGEMSELAARHLMDRGASSVLVSSCSYDRAKDVANAINAKAIRFEELYDTCHLADIVITATSAPHAVFRREHGELFLKRRQYRPMFFIDISVPRNVDPEMNKVEGIFVYDMDDLQQMVADHVANRRKESERAEAIVAAEVARFQADLQTLDVAPMIILLKEKMENIRLAEIRHVRGRLGQLSAEQESAIEALTRGIVNKLMHYPISALKDAARDAGAGALLPVVERLFNIPDEDKDQSYRGRNSLTCAGTKREDSSRRVRVA